MKIILPCDNYIYRIKGVYHSKSQEELDLFKRYLRVFDKIRLIARCSEESEQKSTYVPIEDGRIEIIPLPMFRGPFQYLRNISNIKKAIKHVYEGVDAGVLRLPSIMGSQIGYGLIKRKIPYVTENLFDSQDGYMSSDRLLEKLLWMFMDYLQRHLCYRAEGVSCVTQDYMQRRYFSKKPNSFYSYYSTLALNSSFYTSARKFPYQKSTYCITHIASPVVTSGRKGHKQMILVLKAVREKGLNVILKFVGDGPKSEEIKLQKLADANGVGNSVFFLGYLSKAQIKSLLVDSDIFAMPTKAEGLPRVVIEAMSVGLPCISSRVSGLPELLQGHFLTDYHDVDAISKLVVELLTTPELYEITSRENYEKSKEYEASLLESRRDEFYLSLRNIIKESWQR